MTLDHPGRAVHFNCTQGCTVPAPAAPRFLRATRRKHRVSGGFPASASRVDASVFINGALGWGFGYVFANGATPERYDVIDTRVHAPGCVVQPGR
ncbi:MAG: hypothetical protein ACREP7_05585 [Lysobacter sp.]